MPNEKTRADSLREYLTGASSDNGAQTDPALSLGNYRSSTEALSMGIVIENAIAGITIDYAAGGNAEGAGTLNVVDANTLQWKCYGGAYGDSVSIANGETRIIETLDHPESFIRVSRTSADALTGTSTITLSKRVNNVFGFDDVSSSEALSGDTEYRATIVKNMSVASVKNVKRWIGTLGTEQVSDDSQLPASGAGTISVGSGGDFSDWPDSGWVHIKNGSATREIAYYSSRTNTILSIPSAGRGRLGTTASAGSATDTLFPVPGIAIGIDSTGVFDPTGSAGANIQQVVNENTAPTGITWNTGITSATGLNIGTIGVGEQVGIWIKREIPAGANATPNLEILLYCSFDAA